VIQLQPRRICRFGHEANLKEQKYAHKRTFKPAYFFELLHVVLADDAKKAEDTFRNTPDMKNNYCQGPASSRDVLMPETVTDATVYHHMQKAARQSTLMDTVISGALNMELEIERGETKRLKLQTRQEIVKGNAGSRNTGCPCSRPAGLKARRSKSVQSAHMFLSGLFKMLNHPYHPKRLRGLRSSRDHFAKPSQKWIRLVRACLCRCWTSP
jgi:hypothetical protein